MNDDVSTALAGCINVLLMLFNMAVNMALVVFMVTHW